MTASNDILHLQNKEHSAVLHQAFTILYNKLEQDEILRPVSLMGFKADSKFILKLIEVATVQSLAGPCVAICPNDTRSTLACTRAVLLERLFGLRAFAPLLDRAHGARA